MTEQNASSTKAKATEPSSKSSDPETVTLRLGKERVEVTKPSAEYTQLVHGYGYQEA